jgi:hypothetical protein
MHINENYADWLLSVFNLSLSFSHTTTILDDGGAFSRVVAVNKRENKVSINIQLMFQTTALVSLSLWLLLSSP